MRYNPTHRYEKMKQDKWQVKTDIVTRKIAIGFVVFILVFLFFKMILPSSPN